MNALEDARASRITKADGRKAVNISLHKLMYVLRGEKSLGSKRHLETSIAHLKVLFQRLQVPQGFVIPPGIPNTSAFASRIRTATIINLRHADALTFLEDSLRRE